MLQLNNYTRRLALAALTISGAGLMLSAPLTAEPEVSADTMKASSPMKAQNHWTTLLQRRVISDGDLNRFDYAGLAGSERDMKILADYVADLAAKNPDNFERDEALAYWANLYNALTVQVVAENWPVKSIKEIKSGIFTPGPWKRKLVTVNGQEMSLDDIEHGTMRANYDEPRIHYMVNCASIGCPNLLDTAWSTANLEDRLDEAARAFVNSDRGAVVNNGKLTVSSIYVWFQTDFGGNDAGVIAHLGQYADEDLKAQLDGISKISKDTYDWDVNAK